MKNYLSGNEWASLFIIGCLALTSILPGICFLIYGYIPDFWLRESGLYETIGAAACLIAALFSLISFKLLKNQKNKLNRLWLFLFAITCLFIAGEEISWGQHFFAFEPPSTISSTNFQKEFNLHNSMLIQSSNNSLSSIFFKILMLYLILFPMLLTAMPTLSMWAQKIMIPVPSMRISIIALIAKAGDIANHKIIYGSSFKHDELRLGEAVESIFEICLLILALEIFYIFKSKPHDRKIQPTHN